MHPGVYFKSLFLLYFDVGNTRYNQELVVYCSRILKSKYKFTLEEGSTGGFVSVLHSGDYGGGSNDSVVRWEADRARALSCYCCSLS